MKIIIELRTYMPVELNDEVIKRSEELGISKSEYIRLITSLEISIQKYQQLITYSNLLNNKINEIHQKLGILATPLQSFSDTGVT